VQAAVPSLPFAAGAFDRLITAHFYGHLEGADGPAFLAAARRLAGELVVVDSAVHTGAGPDGWQEQRLRDGSRHVIYKRHFSVPQLRAELGGGEVLFEGRFFVAVRAAFTTPGSRS
jgi:hypothetical protein